MPMLKRLPGNDFRKIKQKRCTEMNTFCAMTNIENC
jgi:hypothetical protein